MWTIVASDMYSDLAIYMSVTAQLGTTESFYVTLALVLVRIGILVLLACFLGWLGVLSMDYLSPVHGRQRIGESAVATSWFIAGFFILIALVVHGAASAPGVLGGPVGAFLADPRRLSLLAASFLISLLLLLAIFLVLDRATPDIPFTNIENNPEAVGIYAFGYLVAFGLILNAAMKVPL